MHPTLRRILERVRLIRPRRGRQAIWEAIDRRVMAPDGTLLAVGSEQYPDIAVRMQQAEGGGVTLPADPSNVKSVTLSAIVTRADGTVENHGVIAEYRKED